VSTGPQLDRSRVASDREAKIRAVGDPQPLTDAALEAAKDPIAWRFSSDSLWRSAQVVRRLHERDVRYGRAGASTKETHEVRLMAVIFRHRHSAPPPPVAHVYMMLAGLSLEALAKGLLVARDPARVAPSTRGGHIDLGWKGSGHLSARLLDEAKIAMSDHDRELVDRLGIFVRWAGRYPVPLNVAEVTPRFEFPPQRGQADPPASWSHHDFEAVSRLRDVLRTDLSEAAHLRFQAVCENRARPNGA